MSIKTVLISIILATIFFMPFKCSRTSTLRNSQIEYSKLDSIWLPFKKALESRDINFLLDNTPDSISCYDCDIDLNNDRVFFNSEYLVKYHLDKFVHLSSLSNEKFSSYEADSNIVKVVYTLKSRNAPEGKYSLIFTLVESKNRYTLTGMMVQ